MALPIDETIALPSATARARHGILPGVLSSLRFRLVLLVLLAVAPVAAVILYNGAERRHAASAEVRQEALQLTEMSVLQQEQVLEGSRQLLVALGSLVQLSGIDALRQETCGPAFAKLKEDFSFYSNLGVVNRQGDLVCSALPLAAPVSLADRSWFIRAQASRSFSVGDYQVGRLTGVPTLNVALPVLDRSGAFTGAIFLAIDLNWLNETLSRTSLPKGAALTLFDRNGTIIARSPDPESWLGQNAAQSPLWQMVSGPSGAAETSGLDGTNRLYGFTSLTNPPDAGLYTTLGIPKSTAFAPIDRETSRNLILLAVAGALALALAGIAGEVFVLRKTRQLVQTTARLSDGDLSARSGPHHGAGELDQLGRALDGMAAAIEERENARQKAVGELHEVNRSLDDRVRARTLELEQEIAQRNVLEDELRAANAELEDFTYIVSHDLKEPLRGIEAFSGFLAEEYTSKLDEDGQRYTSFIRSSALRMKELIDDLLQLSRLGRNDPEMAPVDFDSLMGEIREEMAFTLETKNVVMAVQTGLPTVSCDRLQIKQVLNNLISNAVKFNNKPGPTIEISCVDRCNDYVFAVKDNGIGIDPQYFGKIFQVFQRLHRREDFEGTGAGLAICKKIIEAHGGQVWVESVPGTGSTFSFSLPKQRTATEASK